MVLRFAKNIRMVLPALLLLRAASVPAQVAFQVATDPYETQCSGGCYLIQSCFGQPCYGCCDVSADTCTFCDESWARSYACDAKADVRRFDCNGGEVLPQKSTFFTPKLPTGLVFRLLDEGTDL